MTGGVPNSSNFKSLVGICRSTMPTLPFCLKIDTRKRHHIAEGKAEVRAAHSCNSCWQRSGAMLFIKAMVSSASSDLGFQLPHAAVQPHHRRLADGNVQVARCLVDHGVQQFVDQQGSHDVPID